MNKRLLFSLFAAVLLFLLVISVVVSVHAETLNASNNSSAKQDSVDSAKGDIKNASLSFQQSSNSILQKELGMSPAVEDFFRFIFGFKNEEVMRFDIFIICFCMLILVFLVIRQVVAIVPFISKVPSVSAIIITLLASIGGAIRESGTFFFDSTTMGFLKDWIIIRTIFTILVWVAIFAVFSVVFRMISNKKEVIEAGQKGEKLNEGVAVAEGFNRAAEKMSDAEKKLQRK